MKALNICFEQFLYSVKKYLKVAKIAKEAKW